MKHHFPNDQIEIDSLFQRNLNFGSIYLDIQNISAKIYHSGHFGNFAQVLKDLHREESVFTANELFKIIEQNKVGMDIEREFLSNAIIFKNNLKIILSKLIDDIWENSMQCLHEVSRSHLDQKDSPQINASYNEALVDEEDGDILVENREENPSIPQLSAKSIQNAYKSARNKMADNHSRKDPTTSKKIYTKSKNSTIGNKTSAHKSQKIGSSILLNFSNNEVKQEIQKICQQNQQETFMAGFNITSNFQTEVQSSHPSKDLQSQPRLLSTSQSLVIARRGQTGENRACGNPEASKIAKLIGEKNKDLDSEFLQKHKSCTFSKAKRDFKFISTDGPGPSQHSAKPDSYNFIKRNVYSGVKFSKAPKRFFPDEVPKPTTPGPAYNVRRVFCS